ncbi:MAG: hypothetical protein AW07_04302 [Candidatus Accumulibacter sp. SK-11]|nr:MAG: hypothetical protein AW07_04302 [Candidatus Accumulibacter sp. SK-11]
MRVEAVDVGDLPREEAVAGAVGGMEANVVVAEAVEQRIDLVWIVQIERGMREQAFDDRQGLRQPARRLHRKPLVDHQRLALPAFVEGRQRLPALFAVVLREDGEGGELVAHVVRRRKLAHRQRLHGVRCQFAEISQAEVAQCPPAGCCRRCLVRTVGRQGLVALREAVVQPLRQETAEAVARGMQRVRVDDRHLFGQRCLAGQRQDLCREGGVAVGIPQDLPEGVGEACRPVGCAAGSGVGGAGEDQPAGEALARFPAIEGIAVVGEEEVQLVIAPVVIEDHRRRKTAQQRWHRGGRQALEDELLLVLGQRQDARCLAAIRRIALAGEMQRQIPAVGIDQADCHRHVERRCRAAGGRPRL